MPTCPNCQAEAPAGARFCSACGAVLSETCASCGAALPDGASFCSACGAPVAPDAGGAPSERKLVTVLFADVTGSTSLGEQLDPERLREVLQAYFDAMREEIEAEGGTVEKFIGDAVMAAFGVPVAHEDDPARALRAASRMLRRLEAVNEDLVARHDVRLRIRIGVNTGEVLATTAPQPGEAMVTGDVVNAAARLQAAAEPGTIVLGERTARSVPNVPLIDLGPLELKGKTEAVRGFRLDGEVAPEVVRGVPGLQAPMVGRDADLGLLRSVYERVAAEGRPGLVTVYGDAGVGKSRLTREFLAWAERTDPAPTVLRGRCLPYGDGVAYWPLAEILKGHAGILDSDEPDLAMEKVHKLGRELLTHEVAADPSIATAALAYTVGLADRDARFDELDPRQVRDHLDAAWRSFFTAVARSAPAIVVIEDIHWADPALLDLLESLADRVEGPAMLVCPSRPDLTARRPTWGGGRRAMSAIALDPLTADESERLIQMLLTVDDLPASVHATIVERAEGNPFFLEEIIRRLIDDGSLVRDGDRWRAAATIAEVQIPDTVQTVLASRIDLLDPADKHALQSAAVVGRVFWDGPVADLTGITDRDLDDALLRLQDRELILSRSGSTMAGQREYLFKHILTRDVAYESLPRRERASAHRTVATWIESTEGERAGEFSELLAHHTMTAVRIGREVGDEPDDALRRSAFRWSLRASDDARRRFVLAKSERLAADAVGLAADEVERSDALEALGRTAFDRADGELAWRSFREAAFTRHRADPPDGARVASLCAWACEMPQRWPGSFHGDRLPPEAEVKELFDLGFASLPPGDSRERVRLLSVHAGWPYAFPQEGLTDGEREEFESAGYEAADIALRMGLPNLASQALDTANGAWISIGDYGRVLSSWERRAEILPRVTDDIEVGDFFAMGAWIHWATGEYERALALADEGLDRVRGNAVPLWLFIASWKVLVESRLGRWDGAVEIMAQVNTALGEDREDPPSFTAPAYAVLGMIYARRGEEVASDRLTDLVERFGSYVGGRLYPHRIRLELARGRVDAARALPRPENWRVFTGEALEAEAEVIVARRAWDEAPDAIRDMRAYAAMSPAPTVEAAADRLEGLAAIGAGERDRGLTLLASASDAYGALGCVWDRAVTDLAIAEAGGDPSGERAAAAAVTFEALRVPEAHRPSMSSDDR
jgi:class 3 adenylate cyclase/tetratricopeptide (TPR) repeat protein